jgi:hypothetical protein
MSRGVQPFNQAWPEYKLARDLVGTVFPLGVSEQTIKDVTVSAAASDVITRAPEMAPTHDDRKHDASGHDRGWLVHP